ncbi:MAG: hypothetical protein J6T01_01135 [Kiritimatiellae bacterium]|nr:hypothetical protein [Kiritimatiellia bacterium]
MEDIDFSSDSFDDVTGKDGRYDARAYAFLSECVKSLTEGDRHVDAAEILEEFKERALDQYGPLAYTVLTEWGVNCTEDVGEMMFNLVDSGRFKRDERDAADGFAGGYDFKEAFLEPFQI